MGATIALLVSAIPLWSLRRRLRTLESTLTRLAELDQRLSALTADNARLLDSQRGLMQAVTGALTRDDPTSQDALVNDLLAYLRYEQPPAPERRRPLKLKETLLVLIRTLDAAKGECEVQVSGNEVLVDVDPAAFHHAMETLLTNTFRYANQYVDIHCTTQAGLPTVTIADDGPGVPEAERLHLFEPFVDIGERRTRASGSIGLGLAIVQRVVVGHGGQIKALDSALGGLAFHLTWPAPSPPEDMD